MAFAERHYKNYGTGARHSGAQHQTLADVEVGPPILHRKGGESRRKVGRIVNRVPGLVMHTRLGGSNLGFRALTSAATSGCSIGAGVDY